MQLLTARRPHANRHDGATHSGFNSSCLVLFLALIDLSGMGHVRLGGRAGLSHNEAPTCRVGHPCFPLRPAPEAAE